MNVTCLVCLSIDITRTTTFLQKHGDGQLCSARFHILQNCFVGRHTSEYRLFCVFLAKPAGTLTIGIYIVSNFLRRELRDTIL